MEKKYDSMGILYESHIINDHIILNPMNVVRCNFKDNMTYDVEFLGDTCDVFMGNFENERVSVGFVSTYDELKEKYGSLEAGIKTLQDEMNAHILIQTNNDIDDIIQTYKVDLYSEMVVKIAEYKIDEDELNMLDEKVNISTNSDFSKFDIKNSAFKKQKNKNKIDMTHLYTTIKESIIGQDEVVKKIVSTIDRNYNIDNYRNKTNILLIGPNGSGKSEILRTIAEEINVPITIEDSEQYSAVGYYGDSISDMLIKLYNNANGNLEAAEHGIIAIDEIDKKCTGHKDDVSGARVLNAILTMMEGTVVRINTNGSDYNPNYVMFDTSKVTFVLAGAFSELAIKQKSIGINNELEKQKTYQEITLDDLKKYGLTNDILRRLSIYKLKELTEEDLIKIMKDSKNSALLEYYRYAKKKGVKLNINDKAISKIAKLAIKENTGASSIKAILNNILNDAFFEVGINPGIYSSIRVTEESMDKVPPYILTKKRNTKK